MKKIKFVCVAVMSLMMAASVVSCADDGTKDNGGGAGVDAEEIDRVLQIDFRNKLNGKVSRSAIARAAVEDGKTYSTCTPVAGTVKNAAGLSEDEFNSIIKMEALAEDDASGKKGVKVTYHSPVSQKDSGLDSIRIIYIDGNGNSSTTLQSDSTIWYAAGKGSDEQKADKVFYFPLVQPESKVTLGVCISYRKTVDSTSLDFGAIYTLDTITGLGTVDDLPKNFSKNIASYIIISDEDFTANVDNVIPPDAKSMKKNVMLWFTKNETDRWVNTDREWGAGKEVDISSEKEAFSIDYKDLYTRRSDISSKYKWLFLQFFYSYKIEGYDFDFETPRLESNLRDISKIKTENAASEEGWSIENGTIFSDLSVAKETDGTFTVSFKSAALNNENRVYDYRADDQIVYKVQLKANTRYRISATPYCSEENSALLRPSWIEPEPVACGESFFCFTTGSDGEYSIYFGLFYEADQNLPAATYTVTGFKLEEF